MPLYLHVSESFEERGPYNNGPAFVIQQAVYEVAGILPLPRSACFLIKPKAARI